MCIQDEDCRVYGVDRKIEDMLWVMYWLCATIHTKAKNIYTHHAECQWRFSFSNQTNLFFAWLTQWWLLRVQGMLKWMRSSFAGATVSVLRALKCIYKKGDEQNCWKFTFYRRGQPSVRTDKMNVTNMAQNYRLYFWFSSRFFFRQKICAVSDSQDIFNEERTE